jgi:hypothetical protein
VLFVPGGQAELVHTHRASAKSREWVAYTGHKGQMSAKLPASFCSRQTVSRPCCHEGALKGRNPAATARARDRSLAIAAGFVRLAIEQQAALVPIVVLGEINCLRNFIDAPRLQAWSYKKLGFPVSIQSSLLQSWG